MVGLQLDLLSRQPSWAVQTVGFTLESEMSGQVYRMVGWPHGWFAWGLWARNILREDSIQPKKLGPGMRVSV